jgi:hypothetical protein
MSVLSFSLKNAINRVDNPSADGLFSYGKYTASNVFTIFKNYAYAVDATTNAPLVLPTFDPTKVLGWKDTLVDGSIVISEYPHLGFENLQDNDAITPQPFPEFGIYLHPFYSSVREDVGVRFICPVTANLSIASVIQKGIVAAPTPQGDAIGYRILRSGIEVQTRQLINPSNTPSLINTTISVNQGDIIDFIVDVGDNSNSISDDTALEVTVNVVYTKLPTPTIVTTGINCSTTIIEGKGLFVPSNVVATLYNGNEKITSTTVGIVGGTYNSTFKFTNLDLTNFSGRQLKIRLESPLDTPSDFVFVNIGTDGNCVTFLKPVITKKETCLVSTVNINSFTCVSNRKCAIAVIDTKTKEIVATSIASAQIGDGSFLSPAYVYDRNLDFKSKFKTISVGLGEFIGEPGVPIPFPSLLNIDPITITSFSCNRVVQQVGYIEGYVSSVDKGILLMYESDFTQTDMPILSAPINNGKFSIKIPQDTNGDYVFYTLKLEY